MNISGIVLAAGLSSRMGFPKALLEVKGRTFLDIICGKLAAVCREIIVVVGFRAEKIIPRIDLNSAKIEVVKNKNFERGMLSSLKEALKKMTPASEGFFLNPVDHPFVKEETYRLLAQKWAKRKNRIIIPSYGGRRGHPPILPRIYIPKILELPDDISGGVKAVFPKNGAKILPLETQDKGVIIDVDTPQDYEKLRWLILSN
ncbi:MAG: NTP transferase domain-containing protein [Elusimicrobia bacterium]|nr:NTP transferase domain-containing protein [Elusimicrobiota bacterium]